MDRLIVEKNLREVHQLFANTQEIYHGLSKWISSQWKERDILDGFLDTLGIEKNDESRFAISQRLGYWKFESLSDYLEKIGKNQEERDSFFEQSFLLTRKFVEKVQYNTLVSLREKSLLPEFYMTLLEGTHEIGKAHSDVFLRWNRELLFGVNRELEARFGGDSDKILAFLDENNLFDTGHHGKRADRSYSILRKKWESYEKLAYASIFPEEVHKLVSEIQKLREKLEKLEDTTYDRKQAYLSYYDTLIDAWNETDTDTLVEKWAAVDTAWMAIDTPFQPGHMIESYEDKYRKAVSIETDFRLGNPFLFESKVALEIEQMYEEIFTEIGKEDFEEAYTHSLHSFKQVQLHIGVPYLSYGSFLCGMYSAQVVPNDNEVSKVHGKKIFAFPEFVLQGQRKLPFMQLDNETFENDFLTKYRKFLYGSESRYYKVYDIEVIGHEFGHTLWLAPDTETEMNKKTGLYKNIEEWKATAGGLVAYFMSGVSEYDEDVMVTHIMRTIKLMKFREIEDIIPYYCEALIHLHILFEANIIVRQLGKIHLNLTPETLQTVKEGYMQVYSHLIHTYLHKKDAGDFLYNYVAKENGIFLPKDPEIREFVDTYYEKYKQIGNIVDTSVSQEDYLF